MWAACEASREAREHMRHIYETGKFPWGHPVPKDWCFKQRTHRGYKFYTVEKDPVHVHVVVVSSSLDREKKWLYMTVMKNFARLSIPDLVIAKETFIGERPAALLVPARHGNLNEWLMVAPFEEGVELELHQVSVL